ncbi:unnamed protein product [Gongylonema pulchrum]|uniref:Ion_trans domain-containing protein n=1 Tax=Gongylonema pulchrum TaxID=637853 RepID=A0A183DU71_9BILA|nr:unnamed protein product [Gongylonema pulchrum]
MSGFDAVFLSKREFQGVRNIFELMAFFLTLLPDYISRLSFSTLSLDGASQLSPLSSVLNDTFILMLFSEAAISGFIFRRQLATTKDYHGQVNDFGDEDKPIWAIFSSYS